MYVKSMKENYSLYDAFNFLGLHLYGDEWTGQEVWRDGEEDPEPILKARAPIEQERSEVWEQICAKRDEQKKVEGREEHKRVYLDRT